MDSDKSFEYFYYCFRQIWSTVNRFLVWQSFIETLFKTNAIRRWCSNYIWVYIYICIIIYPLSVAWRVVSWVYLRTVRLVIHFENPKGKPWKWVQWCAVVRVCIPTRWKGRKSTKMISVPIADNDNACASYTYTHIYIWCIFILCKRTKRRQCSLRSLLSGRSDQQPYTIYENDGWPLSIPAGRGRQLRSSFIISISGTQ